MILCHNLKLIFITSGESVTSPSDRALLRSVLSAWARHRPRLFTLPRLLAALRRLGLASAEAWLRLLTSPYHARIGHEVYRILDMIDKYLQYLQIRLVTSPQPEHVKLEVKGRRAVVTWSTSQASLTSSSSLEVR